MVNQSSIDRLRPLFTFADVASGIFDGGIAIDVGQETQTDAVVAIGRVSESVDRDHMGLHLEQFPHARVQLVVRNRAPVGRLLVRHRVHRCNTIARISAIHCHSGDKKGGDLLEGTARGTGPVSIEGSWVCPSS